MSGYLWTAGDAAAATSGNARGGWRGVTGISIDTRSMAPGELFVALAGENRDGHDFVAQALDAGAGAAMVSHVPDGVAEGAPLLVVGDTLDALGALGAAARARSAARVIAVTGSVGKTSTKEMLRAMLGCQGRVHAAEKSFNNHWGVPLTLARMPREAEFAVIEMGMNHRGEIERLAEIAQPAVGLVTNVGTAHIEFLGSQREIASEKGDLFAALPTTGTAVANWDDAYVRAQSRRANCDVLSFGIDPEAAVRAADVRFDPVGVFHFTLVTPRGEAKVAVNGLGETTIINALAAAAVGVACGLEPESLAQGLASYRGVPGRMSKQTLDGNITLIDDSYNANPQSMSASISSLAALKGNGRALAVLGPMGELGENAGQAHRDAGKQIFEAGVALLVTVGDGGRDIAEGAIAAGMAKQQVHCCDTHEAAVDLLHDETREGDWILVKGSRAAQMERIVELLSSEEHR